MASLIDAGGNGFDAASGTIQLDSSGNNRYILAYVIGEGSDADGTKTVTYNGDALSLITSYTSGTFHVFVYGLVAPDTGTNLNLTCTFSSGTPDFGLMGFVFDEIKQTDPVHTTVNVSDTTSPITGSITPENAGDTLVGGWGDADDTASIRAASGTGVVEMFDGLGGSGAGDWGMWGGYRLSAASGANTLGYSGVSDSANGVIVALKAAVDKPNVPTLETADNTETSDTTPKVEFNTTDPSSDDIRYQVQFAFEDPSFTTPDIDVVSGTDSGFANEDNGGDTDPFNSGDTVSFTVQAGDALDRGTYWWRVRASDPNGSNQWSDWSTARAIHVFKSDREATKASVASIPTAVGHQYGLDNAAFIDGEYTNIDSSDDSRVDRTPATGQIPYIYQRVNLGSQKNFDVNFEGQVTSVVTDVTENFESGDLTGFSTSGDANWFVQSTTKNGGTYAAQSGDINDDESSHLEWTVPADGTLSFYWKVSSEESFDELAYFINDVEQTLIDGEVGFVQVTGVSVSEGDVIRWTYRKDGSQSDGSDCGWVDDIFLDVDAADPHVKIDIWDDELTSWENLLDKTDMSAATDFTFSVSKTTNLSKYFDGSFWVTVRAYPTYETEFKVDVFTVTAGSDTASVSPVAMTFTVVAVTALFAVSGIVSPVQSTFTVPSTTATQQILVEAGVSPVSSVYSVPAVTPEAGAPESAVVAPVSTTYTVPSTTATYQAIINAGVAPLGSIFTVPATTATVYQVETATLAPVVSQYSVPATTATYAQVETATLAPASSIFTVPATTGIEAVVVSASVSPVGSIYTVVSTTATYLSVLSAGVTPDSIIFTVPATTATAYQTETASVSPAPVTFTVPATTGTYIQVETATLTPVSSIYSVPTVTATQYIVVNAGVAPVSTTYTVPTPTATYLSVLSATVAPVQITYVIPTTNATYVFVETAGVSPLSATFTVPSTTATYNSVLSASVSPVSITFTPTATTATYASILSAGVSPVSVQFSIPSTTATVEISLTASVSPVAVTYSVPDVSPTTGGTGGVTPVQVQFTVPDVTASLVENAQVSPVRVIFTVPEVDLRVWISKTKTTSIWTEKTKDSASWSEKSKNAASYSNKSKTSASFSNKSKADDSDWTNKNKN